MVKIELERELENRCVAKVEALGGMALKLAIPGVRGFPDRTILPPAVVWKTSHGPLDFNRPGAIRLPPTARPVWFAEFKRLKTGRPSVQQIKWKRDLEALGFKVLLVDTDVQFDAILEEWK